MKLRFYPQHRLPLLKHLLAGNVHAVDTQSSPQAPVAKSATSNYAAHVAIPYSPKLIKGKLANGLTYYIQKNSKPEQS